MIIFTGNFAQENTERMESQWDLKLVPFTGNTLNFSRQIIFFVTVIHMYRLDRTSDRALD